MTNNASFFQDIATTTSGSGGQSINTLPTVFDYIPEELHEQITAGTYTGDVTTFLQNAINDNPRGLIFNPGIYYFIELLFSGTDGHFFGQGVFLKKSTPASNGLRVAGSYNTFEGFRIDGSRNTPVTVANGSAANVLCYGSYNTFKDMASYNGGQGFNLGNSTPGCTGNAVIHCRVFNHYDVGIANYQHAQARIEDCLVYTTGLEGITIDVFSHRSRVLDNEIYNVCQWGGVGAIGWDGSNDVFIERNYINGCPLIGIAVASHSGYSNNGRIVGNRGLNITGDFIQIQYFNGPDLGWGVGPYWPKNTYIADNQCDSTVVGNGITVQAGVTGTTIGPNALNGRPIVDLGTSTSLLIQGAGFRNKLRNAQFLVNQRNVSGTVTLAAGAYGHDGVKAGSSGATYTFAQSGTDVTLTITAGSLIMPIEASFIEGGSFFFSQAGSAQARVWQGTGYTGSGSYAAPGFSATLTANTQTNVEFSTGTVLRPQLEAGGSATPFERRPYQAELAFCQRYYLFLNGAAGGFAGIGVGTIANNTRTNSVSIRFPVTMRAVPTIGYLNPNSTLQCYNASALFSQPINGVAYSGCGLNGAAIDVTFPVTSGYTTAGMAVGVVASNVNDGLTFSADI